MESWVKVVAFYLVICFAKGLNKDVYQCGPAGHVCYPKNYTRGIPKNHRHLKLYAFIVSAQTALKKVNEHEMVVTYEPWVLLIWQDPRLQFSNVPDIQSMPDEMAKIIWIPDIVVENQVATKQSVGDGDVSMYHAAKKLGLALLCLVSHYRHMGLECILG